MKPSKDATQLINALYRGGTYGYYWRLDTKQTTWFECNNLAEIPTNENIYFGVHPSRIKKNGRADGESIQVINCLYAEFDAKDFDSKDSALNHILDLEINPSICIDSGGGYHCYWILAEPVLIDDDNREEMRTLQAGWVETVGGDPGAKDLARILRIPDTYNNKYTPKRKVEKVWIDPETTFTLHELETLIAKPKRDSQPTPANRIYSNDDWQKSLVHWTDKALDRARPGNRDNTGVWLSAQLRDAGLTQEQAISSDYPERVPQTKDRYTRKDWERTVKSIFKGKRREPAINLNAPAPQPLQQAKTSEATGMKIQQAIETPTPEKPPRFVAKSASDALKPQPPLEYVIDKIITKGSVNLFYGEAGSKKTYALLYASACCSVGKNFLNYKTKKSKVLIVDEESGDKRLLRRLGEILRGSLIDDPSNIDYISLERLKLDNLNDTMDLTDFINQNSYELIVIDALSEVMDGDENSKKDVQPVFDNLKQIVKHTDATIFLIHHPNKMGGYRGSSAIKGNVDLMVEVVSQDGNEIIKFSTMKERDIEKTSFMAKAIWEGDQFYLQPLGFEDQIETLSETEQYVIETIKESGELFINDIEVKGKKENFTASGIRQAIKNLVKNNLIVRTNPGGRGKPAKYGITPRNGES